MATWLKDFAVLGHAALAWLASWWRVIHLGALMLVLALSPSSHRSNRRLAVLRQLYLATGPILAWFGVLSALISLIVIRIVVVTALSYGLSQYALEMVVRVLVLELIPLTAALFAALRVTLPNGAEVAAMNRVASSPRWHARAPILWRRKCCRACWQACSRSRCWPP